MPIGAGEGNQKLAASSSEHHWTTGNLRFTRDMLHGRGADVCSCHKAINAQARRVATLQSSICESTGISRHFVCMVLQEYMGNGDLADAIMAGSVDEAMARRVFTQLVSALNGLHDHDVVHGDVKCDNILLDAQRNARLTDFEHSIRLSEQQTTHYSNVCHGVRTRAACTCHNNSALICLRRVGALARCRTTRRRCL
jgi:serine/threonine protein kinase